MTATPPAVEDALLPVIQEDRDAAANLSNGNGCNWYAPSVLKAIRDGERDDVPLVQAFARHRTRSTLLAEHGELVGWQDAKAIAATAVQSACETDPADPEHPDTILIDANDLLTIVCSAVENHNLQHGPEAATAISALMEERGRLREGLRPFADFISAVESAERLPQPVEDYDCVSVQVGLLRRARRLIEGEGI